jgi:phosphohistidine swiveling domain-containing protein
MTSGWILPLYAQGVSLHVAGGKGANLAQLVTARFPVPPGFVLTTDAYRAFVAHNELGSFLQSTLGHLDAQDPAALEAASAAIRERFAVSGLPPQVRGALREAYDALGETPVAVRSSATAEDLPELSFAGQQDTYLNVSGEDALLGAVVACWGSLWTARAIGYRARSEFVHKDLALAVVVQEMVPAEAAGVLFTADPLSGKRTEMVLEATLGLGEALVSGRVEPDRFRIDAASGRILERSLGAKAISVRPESGGGTVTRVEDATGRQALPDEAIAELVHLGGRAARLFGAPQDVEWAWAGGRIWLVQSRPITALYPVPEGMEPEPLQVLFSFGAVQGLMGPMTPMGQDTARNLIAGAGRMFGVHLTAETQTIFYSAAERVFVDITGVLRNRVGRRLGTAFLGVVEPGVRQALVPLLEDARLAVTGGPKPRTVWRVLRFALPLLPHLAGTLLRPEASRARFEEETEARLVEIEAQMAAQTTLAGRVTLMEELIQGAFPWLLPRFLPRFAVAMASLNLLLRAARDLPGGEQAALMMTRGLPHNVTTAMDLALWAAAQAIREDPASLERMREGDAGALADQFLVNRLPATAQEAIGAFLGRYGMRGVGEIDLGRRRWRENPEPIVQALQSYLQIEDPAQASDAVFARGAAEAQAAEDAMARAAGTMRRGRFKARRVRWLACRMRALAGLRESPKFWAVRTMSLVRAALLVSGADLVQAGVLERAGDLFFLRLPELRALAAGEERGWRGLVSQRRQVYAREERRAQVPRLLLSDGQAFYEGVSAPGEELDGVLVGSPVSPGVAEGRVRVVLDPHAAQLAPGEILVCPGTDPAWTPLFLAAGGLVMETGGLMTHGSVVAREYGIPAVVGVTRASDRLKTGQRVRVDGTAGQVILLDGE